MSKFLCFYQFVLQHNYHACCKTSCASCHRRIILHRFRVALLHRDILYHRYPCRIVWLLSCYSYVAHHVTHCLVSMLCHFAILHVSHVTLCRFRGTSCYISVISCLVTSPLRDSSPLSSRKTLSSFLFPIALGIVLSIFLTSFMSSSYIV